MSRLFLLSYCLVYFFACCWLGVAAENDLRIANQWAELQFEFPSAEAERIATEKNYYIRGASVPMDVDVYHREGSSSPRKFITIPRFGTGRPITFGTVQNDCIDECRIKGYPDYAWHDNQGQNCAGMTSVFRVAIDQCQRLWVMDSGKIGGTQHCPPKLMAFDLTTDTLIYSHTFNESSYSESSLFVTPVLDIRPRVVGDCVLPYVYVADGLGFGLVVVDVFSNKSWRVTHRYFYPYPSRMVFSIAGVRFPMTDGVLGMALSPYNAGYERNLYFHALAATTENVISTSILRNSTNTGTRELDIDSIYAFPKERPTQSAAEAIDSNGIMYFGMMDPPAIYCWNTATEFSPRNFHVIAMDQETLQFAGGLKVVMNTNGDEELWILTSSFQRVETGTISADRINYRIHTETISTLLQKSPCKDGWRKIGYYY